AGRLSSRTNPHGGVTTWSYDAVGMLKTRTDPNGVTQTFSYDDSQRVLSEAWSTAPDAPIEWSYDEGGLLLGVTWQGGAWSYDYWPTGKVKSENNAGTAAAPSLTLTFGVDVGGVLSNGYS